MRYEFKQYEAPILLEGHLNLGGSNPEGESIEVTSGYLTRGGRPWIPVMGEYHFSRADRASWRVELAKMKAGGITLVSTYLFWIYHEEIEGQLDFTGDNDVRAFVRACGDLGLDVILRVGPWAHGECRNGGLPDWLLQKPCRLRENNPEYLGLVRGWYKAVEEQVRGLFYKDGGNIVGVQLENEYVDNAQHLAELKKIALECGLVVPLYTVTGWNSSAGARIPVDEVLPVFGGYCEAPWEPHLDRLPPSPHYFFDRMRNDSAIGADLIAASPADDGWQLPYERYPFATCELGGGIQVTHHRRPVISGMDIYAVALVKLGDGNNLPGYYMYHGGTNKVGKLSTLQESRATGYPNDYPVLSYDFQAAVSEFGEIREQYRLLNLLHLFLQDFQEEFAPMAAVDAKETVPRSDTSSLRYGMRTNGQSGFVFVNHYQRLTRLEDVKQAVIDTGSVVFPPIDVTGGVSFFLPFHMDLGGLDLEYALCQPVCRQENTFFFVQIPGISAEYMLDGIRYRTAAGEVIKAGNIRIVTLDLHQARYLRKLDGQVYLGDECDLYLADRTESPEGQSPKDEKTENDCEAQGWKIKSVSGGSFSYRVWDGEKFYRLENQRFMDIPLVGVEKVKKPPFKLDDMLTGELSLGGKRDVTWKRLVVTGSHGFVEIKDRCDVSQLYVDGKLVADNFYYGKPWRLPAAKLKGRECYLALSEMKDDFYREF